MVTEIINQSIVWVPNEDKLSQFHFTLLVPSLHDDYSSSASTMSLRSPIVGRKSKKTERRKIYVDDFFDHQYTEVWKTLPNWKIIRKGFCVSYCFKLVTPAGFEPAALRFEV